MFQIEECDYPSVSVSLDPLCDGFSFARLMDRLSEVEEMEEELRRPPIRSEKGPLRRHANRNKARYGGEKSWQQHLPYGIPCVVLRQAADERYWRQILQEEGQGDDLELSSISLGSVVEDDQVFPETAPREGALDTSCGECQLTVDVGADFDAHVFLNYGADGKLATAHCRLQRRYLWESRHNVSQQATLRKDL